MGRTGLTRRKFLRTSLAVAAGTAVPLAGYSQFIEPYHLTTTRLEFRIPNLPEAFDGFRICQLSDFHYGAYTGAREISAAVALANSLNPDFVVLTGDFITSPGQPVSLTHRVFTDMALCAEVLSGLKAPTGVFACLGNHDAAFNSSYVSEVLTSFRISVLTNSKWPIERAGKRLWLIGVDDGIFGRPDFKQALKGIAPNETVVLISHEPDLADEAARYPIAVQLSGHSHGGQIRIPGFTGLFLPELAQTYPFGYYRIRDMHLYTNRGIGTVVLPYRFNAPPEVTLITIRTS